MVTLNLFTKSNLSTLSTRRCRVSSSTFGVKKTRYLQLLSHSNLWFIYLVKYNNRVKHTPKNIVPLKWNFQKEIILRKCCNAFDSCYPNCQILYKCYGDFSLYKCNSLDSRYPNWPSCINASMFFSCINAIKFLVEMPLVLGLYKCNPSPGLTLSELTLLYKCQHVFFLYKCH